MLYRILRCTTRWYGKDIPRGGSDITGSVIARGLRFACMKTGRTFPDKMADPRIIPEALTIKSITYRASGALYMGANVLHEEAVFPVREMGIPINVKHQYADEPGL